MLIKVKQNVKSFVDGSALSQLESGECSVAYSWDYTYLMADSKDYWDKFDIVDDSAIGYTQNWAIAKTSKHQKLANEFINFSLEPEQQAEALIEYSGVPLLKEDLVKDLLPEDYFDNPCIEKYKTLWANREEDTTVSDEQIDKTDKLYNELMTNQ